MPATLTLVDRAPITYESAIDQDGNFINHAAYVAAQETLYRRIWRERDSIVAVVEHHLNLRPRGAYKVTVAEQIQWIRGSFNVCIPVEVMPPPPTTNSLPSGASAASLKLMFRCPLPHKLAEKRYPGTVDEKMGCEIGAYVWMQEHCPDIRIPELHGFGFSEHRQGAQFTHESHRPWYVYVIQALRRLTYRLFRYPFLQYPLLSRYIPHSTSSPKQLSTAYMLLEHISPETGQMLSNTYQKQRLEPKRRQKLFRGLARIILSIARVPQPRIGSFQFHKDGTITLANRPLTTAIMILENDGAPRSIDRPFASTDAYTSDMLSFHEGRFLTHPNAVYNDGDCRRRMAAQVVLRASSHRHINSLRRAGPFLLQLTDLHASNVLVDKDWNITCLIDLEWICALPAEALDVPYWLTGCGIDEICDERLPEYETVRSEFLHAFEQEEREAPTAGHNIVLSQVLSSSWDSGSVWFWHCITSINGTFSLVKQHLGPQLSLRLYATNLEEVLFKLWCVGAEAVVEKKVAQYKEYETQLQKLYAEVESRSASKPTDLQDAS